MELPDCRNVAVVVEDPEARVAAKKPSGRLPKNICYCAEPKRRGCNTDKLHLIHEEAEEGPAKKKARHGSSCLGGTGSGCCKQQGFVQAVRSAMRDIL